MWQALLSALVSQGQLESEENFSDDSYVLAQEGGTPRSGKSQTRKRWKWMVPIEDAIPRREFGVKVFLQKARTLA